LRIANALDHGLLVEVEAGKITRVGVVLVADIDSVRAMIDGRLERRQTASRADEFWKFRVLHGMPRKMKQQVYRADGQLA